MNIFSAFRHSGWSMKRKLFGYMFLLAILLFLALILGLLLFGRFESAEKNTHEALDIQMEVFEKDIAAHFDRLAAASIQLSGDVTELLEEFFSQEGISFHNLDNHETAIGEIQEALMEPLRQKLLQENCSGIFVMLDATINSNVKNAEYSRTGTYLQQSGYKSTDDSILLYRGLAETGKSHGILPHRKWRLEFRTDLFPNYAEVLQLATLPPEESYFLTEKFTLPGTSENAVLMVSPIVGTDGVLYGICGYEVSASYFAAFHAQPSKISHLTCLLATTEGRSVNASAGLSCGVANGYYRAPKGMLTVDDETENLKNLVFLSGSNSSYTGVLRDISLTPNNAPYTIAAMMLKSDYDRITTKTFLQNLVLWVLLLFFTVSCCLYFSRRYLSPILKGLEQIKSDERAGAKSQIPEINDLFVFLSEQDRKYEDSLNTLTQEKQSALSEQQRLQLEYEQAQSAYEKAQTEYTRAQEELNSAKKELDRLAYSRKNEIDPQDFENFLIGMKTLTETERRIFEWYLEGKTEKEILELTGTRESTLKFHNHNILNKLGVPSRKQMLRFAALMKLREKEGNVT